MTEPHAGSDVQAIRTRAVRDGDEFVIDGQKMWVTNGLRAGIVMLLANTDPDAAPRAHRHDRVHRAQGAGGRVDAGADDPAAAEEARLQGRRVDRARLRRLPHPGGVGARRRGRRRRGLQVLHERDRGRPRQRRRARRSASPTSAFEHSIRYAQERMAFGKPIAQHQADPDDARADGDKRRGGASCSCSRRRG